MTAQANGTLPSLPALQKAVCPCFYRYSSLSGERRDWLRQIILENLIYVPTLAQLRDPADGRPKLARQTEGQLFSFLYNSDCGVLRTNPGLSVEEQVKEAAIIQFNVAKHGTEVLMRETAKILNSKLESWRVYSLSKRYDNMSMWENYAENHAGYCLEFANSGAFFSKAIEINYENSIELDLSRPDHRRAFWLFCKKREYSYEEEVRVLVPRWSDGKVQIDSGCLRRVILGRNMPDSDRATIREWARQRSPELNVATAAYDELEQTIRLVDDHH
jgi:hypothetical protein